MVLTTEQKDKLLQVIEDKKNKGAVLKTKKSHGTNKGKTRKAFNNKKTGGVFDK